MSLRGIRSHLRRVILAMAMLGLVSCQRPPETAYVDVANPFLISTVASLQLVAREAAVKKDVTALANEVFLLKRSLPTAWAEVVDSSGTVLMDFDPKAIAAIVTDPLSLESLAYADRTRPLIRRLWSDDHRPVLDFTMPVIVGSSATEKAAGYVRVGFFSGGAAQAWAAPRGDEPASH